MHSAESGTSLLLAIFTAMAMTQHAPAQVPTAQAPAPVAPLSAPATQTVLRMSTTLASIPAAAQKVDRKN
jgi:hypothetical protein